MDTTPQFPSQEHQKALRLKASLEASSGIDLDLLTEDERWMWHAYIYSFRHVTLGKRLDEPSPIDPKGAWFLESLARRAAEMWATKKPA